MKLVWKILRSHISIAQLAGFCFANLIGVTIILIGIQFYSDYQALDNEDTFMKADYLILNKKVGVVSSFSSDATGFSADDIDELQDQDFVERIGYFTPSSFGVRAWFDIQDFMQFSTDMFFESVPDDFVDVKSDRWHYQEGSNEIPIILPKNYLFDIFQFD